MFHSIAFIAFCSVLFFAGPIQAQRSVGRTTLTQSEPEFESIGADSVTIERGPVTIVVASNEALPPHHRARYNGVASLTHAKRGQNVFVPEYAGLNLEHIHDGSTHLACFSFEPRSAAMHLRRIDPFTVELHQPPTPHWKLESCTRFRLLADGTIEMVFECIPREAVFKYGYIGLFWASYIHEPESKAIHFLGRSRDAAADTPAKWIDAISPEHGIDSTHVGADDLRKFVRDPEFNARYMVFSFSKHLYAQPFYYGLSHGMVLAYVFNPNDHIWFCQSPTGGGAKNPAWDFQFFIPEARVDASYGFTMRLLYLPTTDRQKIAERCIGHVKELIREASEP